MVNLPLSLAGVISPAAFGVARATTRVIAATALAFTGVFVRLPLGIALLLLLFGSLLTGLSRQSCRLVLQG
jgi:uncharacterized membrane protein